MGDAAHWDERYESVTAEKLSWFEPEPQVSLELLAALGVGPADSVIDVGAGASALVDDLLAAGHTDLTVLDLSHVALGIAQQRLGDVAGVTFLEADVLTWRPDRQWHVWHDRAVLHFLTAEDDCAAYVEQLHRMLRPRGAFVIGTFAEDGPTECSALPVRRYSSEALRTLLGDVDVVEQRRHVHRTPGGADQPFNWIAGRIR